MPDLGNNGGDLNGDAKVPVPDIPNLKKKEKKRSGVAWGGGGASAPAGLARAAASAASGAGGLAAEGAGAAGAAGAQSAGWLAQLLATTAGKMLAAAIAASVVGGGAVVANRVLSSGEAGAGGANLGGISDTIRIHKAGAGNSRALKYAAQEGQGELKFAQTTKEAADAQKAAAEAQAPGADKGQDAGQANQLAEGGVQPGAATPGLEHNLSGAKLSTSLGNQFGGKNIFSGDGAPKFGGGAGLGGLQAPNLKISKVRGMTRAMARASNAAPGKALGKSSGLKSDKALGQLRKMATLNSAIRQGPAKTGATESNRVAATQQFEGAGASQSQAPTSPTDKLPTVNPVGGPGAPAQDISGCPSGWYIDKSGHCSTDYTTTSQDVTPWRKEIEALKYLIMFMQMMMGLVTGIILSAIVFNSICCTKPLGKVFQVVAMVMSIVMIVAAVSIITLGITLNSKYGQSQQGNMIAAMGGLMLVASVFSLIAAINADSPTAMKDLIKKHFYMALGIAAIALMSAFFQQIFDTKGKMLNDTQEHQQTRHQTM